MSAPSLTAVRPAAAPPPRRLAPQARRVPRVVHPVAWWLWAFGLVAVASHTTNPLLLVLVLAVAGTVVAVRRTDAPWARAFPAYLRLGLAVIALRVVFRAVFGADTDPAAHVLVHLPQVPLPSWATGVQLGGPVTLEGMLAALYDGLRLATLLACIGAANALANPKRALRVLPGALYELGAAVVVAVTVAPQLIESARRVRRARQLRGGGQSGFRVLRAIAMPVLQDALERSLRLAAAMDSRGYGRRAQVTRGQRHLTTGLLLAGLLALCGGTYALLGGAASARVVLPAMLAGGALCAGGLALGSRRVVHTAYRPDPWRWPESLVAGSGVAAALVVAFAGRYDAANLDPSLHPLAWPALPWLPVVGILLAALAAPAAPPVPSSRDRAHAAAADA